MVVLRREGLWLISNHCNTVWNNWGLMALDKVLHSTRFLGYSSVSEANECQRLNNQKARIGVGSGSNVNTRYGLSLKGCLDHRRASDGIAKDRTMAWKPQLVREPGLVLGEEVGVKLVNGNGSCKHGRHLGSPNQSMPEKMVVAVDVDEGIRSRPSQYPNYHCVVSIFILLAFYAIASAYVLDSEISCALVGDTMV